MISVGTSAAVLLSYTGAQYIHWEIGIEKVIKPCTSK
jgi:hypothetical protein